MVLRSVEIIETNCNDFKAIIKRFSNRFAKISKLFDSDFKQRRILWGFRRITAPKQEFFGYDPCK